jgi:hypothetical protein
VRRQITVSPALTVVGSVVGVVAMARVVLQAAI